MIVESISMESFVVELKVNAGEFSLNENVGDEMEEDEIDEGELREESKMKILDLLPDETIHLGSLVYEIDNRGTYEYTDEYFIMSLKEGNYNWALFRLYWDDNWGKWEICPEARCKALSEDYRLVASTILPVVWNSRGIDLDDEEYLEYKEFLSVI
jgi:hypothetical protein